MELLVSDCNEIEDDSERPKTPQPNGNNSSDTPIEEPREGLVFNSPDDLFEYYQRYATQQGFAVAKRTSRKREDGHLYDVLYECNRSGQPKNRSKKLVATNPQTKIGCRARLTAGVLQDGKWVIRSVRHEHNHSLSPVKVKYFNCNRKIDEHTKRRLELNDRAGIRLNKSIDSLHLEAGGFDKLSFTSRDCRNYLDKIRRLQLVGGDAEAMHQYFMKMESDNSEFFYAMDLDEECRLRNVFWADARSRAACKEFGDVVTFDTTYLVNKYDMPFAPFGGVNHHGQSILLGCGLISSEDKESFQWLFETWKTCMRGDPKGIITDQCMAMKNAIEIVFPDTRHRWCIWHIMKKIPEKLSGYNDYERISWHMRHAVYDSYSPEEFETEWNAFITKYGLQDNVWLHSLYLERQRWVPVYVKDVFWAGMSSTQRSESMNAYFDGFIHSKTTLKQFVEQYEVALKKKVENEQEADASSWKTYIPCMFDDNELEKQFHDAYTHDKVKEFHEQFSGKCQLGSVSGDEQEVKEWVRIGEDGENKKKRVCFKVIFNSETNEARCSCRLFEFRGMVCKHQLAVWDDKGVFKVPDKYILRRWCKNVRRDHTKIRINYDKSSRGTEAMRHDSICGLFKDVAYLAENSEEMYERVMKLGNELKAEFEKTLGFCDSKKIDHNNGLGNEIDAGDVSCAGGDGKSPPHEDVTIRDPKVVKSKGRPRVRRFKSPTEKATKVVKTSIVKGKTKGRKKKQIIDTANAGNETQPDILNVSPCSVEMAAMDPWNNPLQNSMKSAQCHLTNNLEGLNQRGLQSYALIDYQCQDFRTSQVNLAGSQASCETYTRGGYETHLSILNRFTGHGGGESSFIGHSGEESNLFCRIVDNGQGT